jgi:hypothetical protein
MIATAVSFDARTRGAPATIQREARAFDDTRYPEDARRFVLPRSASGRLCSDDCGERSRRPQSGTEAARTKSYRHAGSSFRSCVRQVQQKGDQARPGKKGRLIHKRSVGRGCGSRSPAGAELRR